MENRAKKAAELRRREHALFAAAERETAKDEPWSVANARARLNLWFQVARERSALLLAYLRERRARKHS